MSQFREVYVRHVQRFEAFTDNGIAMNSGSLNGLPTEEAKAKIIGELESRGIGKRRVNYKLRDWVFSRQRYWGEPFPILHEVDASGKPIGVIRPLTERDLPVRLPELEDFKPANDPAGPLSKATDWVNVTLDGKRYRRETNTMPQWAGSCWYYLRYLDPKNPNAFCDPRFAKYWLPVDLYVGGAEHAVLHLLYSRFWHKVLFDRGYLPTAEPFQRLVNQGMILGEMEYHGFETEDGRPVSADRAVKLEGVGYVEEEATIHVSPNGTKSTRLTRKQPIVKLREVSLNEDDIEQRGAKAVRKGSDNVFVLPRSYKMSKSRGNVINPDDVVRDYGADSLRLYEMFMGPLEAMKPWSMRSVAGVSKFLARVWRLIVDEAAETPVVNATVKDIEPDAETLKLLHKTIKKVTEDTEHLRFNTAIAAMMEFTNHLTSKVEVRPVKVLEPFILLLAPYAPHIAEELWQVLGHQTSLAYAPWPKFDPALVRDDEVEIPVMISNKIKARLMVPADADAATLEKIALADPKVQEQIAGKTVKKVIVKPKQMVSIVVG